MGCAQRIPYPAGTFLDASRRSVTDSDPAGRTIPSERARHFFHKTAQIKKKRKHAPQVAKCRSGGPLPRSGLHFAPFGGNPSPLPRFFLFTLIYPEDFQLLQLHVSTRRHLNLLSRTGSILLCLLLALSLRAAPSSSHVHVYGRSSTALASSPAAVAVATPWEARRETRRTHGGGGGDDGDGGGGGGSGGGGDDGGRLRRPARAPQAPISPRECDASTPGTLSTVLMPARSSD